MPAKNWSVGESLLAADLNTILANQVVATFADAAARGAGIPSPTVNQLSMLATAPGRVDYWTGSVWSPTVGALAYAETTVNKTVTATLEASADLVVAAPTITFDGVSPVLVECYASAVQVPGAAGAYLILYLYQDGVSIGRLGTVLTPAVGAQMVTPVHLTRRFTPTAGSHTLSLVATVSAASGIVYAGPGGAGQYMPGFIRITRGA